jgi:NADPH2 dehydrogenase
MYEIAKAECDIYQTDMGMKDPVPQFTHIITSIRDRYPDVSYIHIVEPRVDATFTRESISSHEVDESDVLHDLWAPRPLISAGAYDRKLGLEVAEKEGHLIAYGRPFIANVRFI